MLDMNTVKLGFIGYGNMAGGHSRRTHAVRRDQTAADLRVREGLPQALRQGRSAGDQRL